MIIIGSRAMEQFYQREVGRFLHTRDWDVLMTEEEFHKWYSDNSKSILSLTPSSDNKYKAIVQTGLLRAGYEIEIGFDGTSTKLLLDNEQKVCTRITTGFLLEAFFVLSPQYQMLTKRSHLIYPVHWEKNIKDYHFLKSQLGDFERDDLMKKYYKLRSNEAKARYKQRVPKLNVTNEDFFSSKLAVPNYFVHDDIHEVMAHHDKPVYEMLKHEDKMDLAWCEKDLFFQLPYDYQVQCVQEEAYVIALERYIIPQHLELDPFNAYHNAVKRICTTLCSGWFRKFAIENYPVIIDRYNPQYVEKFVQAVESDKIKTIEGVHRVPLINRD